MYANEGILFFNNHNNLQYNLYITDYPEIELNNEVYEEQPIEGRNGSIYTDLNYYKDRKLDFSFDLIEKHDINDELFQVKDWLLNVSDYRLIFNNNYCYMVKKVILNSYKQTARNIAELKVSFIVEPFLYGINEIVKTYTEKNFSIANKGTYKSDTIVEIYGNGNIQLSINGETMQIDNVKDYVLIDSKEKEIIDKNGKSKDWDTTGDFLSLDIGVNTIELTGNVTKTTIKYRNTYL